MKILLDNFDLKRGKSHGKVLYFIPSYLKPVSNVALLPYRTQFINYKYMTINLKVF